MEWLMAMTKTDQELIERWIEPDPDERGPHEARLKQYGISAWAIIGVWKKSDGNIEAVISNCEVPREAVEAMLALYRRYAPYIDARILLNDAAFEDWSSLVD
jgi:hypothetical protein